MAVHWSNPAEHFHVTQLAIRGVDAVTLVQYLTSFSQLHVLQVSDPSPELVAEIGKHLPKCRVEEE